MPVRHIDEIGVLYEKSVVGDMEQLEQDTSDLKQTGPEAADGFHHPEIDPKKKGREDSTYNEDELSNNVEQNDEKSVKKEQKEINNSTMRENPNKSTFDKLFEDVMGGEDPMNMDLDMAPAGDDLDEVGDEDLGDTVSIDLPRDVAEQLHTALGELLEGGEDDLDDIENIEDVEDDEAFEESHVELEAGPSDAVSKLATQNGGNNKVGGDANPAGGHADSGTGGQEDGGKPKPAPDSVAALTGKNNKVGGKVTGGNKHAFKA